MEQGDKTNSASTNETVLKIDCGFMRSLHEYHTLEEGLEFNPSLRQRNDTLMIRISPEVRLTDLDSMDDNEVGQYAEPCEPQATLKEQKLARALRYALSIIASYESNIKNNSVALPIGFCQSHVFGSARSDILQIAGIKADADLYNSPYAALLGPRDIK